MQFRFEQRHSTSALAPSSVRGSLSVSISPTCHPLWGGQSGSVLRMTRDWMQELAPLTPPPINENALFYEKLFSQIKATEARGGNWIPACARMTMRRPCRVFSSAELNQPTLRANALAGFCHQQFVDTLFPATCLALRFSRRCPQIK